MRLGRKLRVRRAKSSVVQRCGEDDGGGGGGAGADGGICWGASMLSFALLGLVYAFAPVVRPSGGGRRLAGTTSYVMAMEFVGRNGERR